MSFDDFNKMSILSLTIKVQAALNFRSSICVQMNFNVDIRDPRPKITRKKFEFSMVDLMQQHIFLFIYLF